jgi:hypothetical protein
MISTLSMNIQTGTLCISTLSAKSPSILEHRSSSLSSQFRFRVFPTYRQNMQYEVKRSLVGPSRFPLFSKCSHSYFISIVCVKCVACSLPSFWSAVENREWNSLRSNLNPSWSGSSSAVDQFCTKLSHVARLG